MTTSALSAVFLLLCCLQKAHSVCDSPQLQAGVFFQCQLDRGDFFPDLTSSSVIVSVSVSLQGNAGPPEWLRLLPDNGVLPATLYGTPGEKDIGENTLMITARRNDTFASEERELTIAVRQLRGNILLQSELVVTGYEIGDFLREDVIERFNMVLRRAFQNDQALILQVTSNSPQRIIVMATPGLNVDSVSMATAEEASSVQASCGDDDNISRPPENFEVFSQEGFDIDWCQYRSYQVPSDGDDVTVDPALDRPRPRPEGSSVSLVVVVVVFSVVIVMVVTGLAWVFLGRRKRAFYIPRERKERRIAMDKQVYSSTKETALTQTRLRDLAQPPPMSRRRSNSLSLEERGVAAARPLSQSSAEEGLLEYHDVTDYSQDDDTPPQTPPPAYMYPENLLTDPLNKPRRYRLITL